MKQSLNFNWKFIPRFSNDYLNKMPIEAVNVDIPHTVKELPYNYFPGESYQFVSTYEKIFDVDNYDKNKRYFIRFNGYMVSATIYFNGVNLGNKPSAYIPVELEVSEYIKEKDNRLLVILDSKEDDDVPPFGFAIDYVTFGGIYREVYLISEPKTFIKNIYVHGDMNGLINISYEKDGNDEIDVSHKILDINKNVIASFDTNEYQLDKNKFKLWDIDNPNLYILETAIKLDNDENIYHTRFGFRDIEFTNHGFYLNKKKIKLVGLNRHQGYPYMGYAASKSLQEEDALILKNQIGLNVVRTSHYPQSEHFLNKCDEIGLLMINEIPGWQHIGSSKKWRDNCLRNTEIMVIEQRNHPSLIAHGVRIDESIDDEDLYKQTNKIAHELDPYRQTIGVRNFQNSQLLEDIYGFNDFSCWSVKEGVGLAKPSSTKTNNKPLLITEYMGHMDPYKPTTDQPKKLEISLKHAKVQNDNFKYEEICGAIGWCFVDYNTHVDFGSGDYICAHGVYDMFRNPKLSSYIYASQQDKFPVMKLLSNMKPGDIPASNFGDLYVATNCDYIELYNNGEFVGKFTAKRDNFSHLPHPPILIDDLIGDTFKEDKFSPSISKKISKALSFAALYGLGSIKFKHKILLAYVMKKYKVDYTELVGYWVKYVGTWGGKAKIFKIKGYKDGQLVKEEEFGPSDNFNYVIEPSKLELINEDTYDTVTIRIKHIDNHNNIAEYSSRPVKVTTTGPIELIGPSIQNLLAGQLTLYIKSKNIKGKGKVLIEIDDFVKEIELEVK